MENTKLIFNDTTYEFNYFLGRNEKTDDIYDCYGVYINGERNTDYVLEAGTETTGNNTPKKVWNLYYKSFYCMVSINDFSLEEIVKVISYIREREGENLLDGLVEIPNNFDEEFSHLLNPKNK